jgi:hypothetical protein
VNGSHPGELWRLKKSDCRLLGSVIASEMSVPTMQYYERPIVYVICKSEINVMPIPSQHSCLQSEGGSSLNFKPGAIWKRRKQRKCEPAKVEGN